jgi:methylmalonyl-CoA/ethylmalonyl-CoA epimerase
MMTDKSVGTLATVKSLGISLAVSNLESTAKWYKEQLGFEEVLRREFSEYGTRIVFLEVNGVRIELIEDQKWHPIDRPNPPQHTTVQGVSQITFKVDNIEEVIERVKSRPITIAWDLVVVEDIGFKEFFIRDNEGNIVQFVETFEPIQS